MAAEARPPPNIPRGLTHDRFLPILEGVQQPSLALPLTLGFASLLLAAPTAALAEVDGGPGAVMPGAGVAPDGGVSPAPAPNPLVPWPAPNPLLPYQPPPPEAAPPSWPAPENPPPPYAAPPNMRWVLVDPNAMPPPPEPGFHRHDGFYMRGVMGFAVGEMRGDLANGQLQISGSGIAEAFAFGYAIKENVIVYGEYGIAGLFTATASGAGKNPNTSSTNPLTLSFAPGLAYYLEPQNLYVSGALGLAFSIATEKLNGGEVTSIQHDSGAGIGGNLTLGKEWWVSANWGLGVALRGSFARAREKTTDYLWWSYFVAALFSATYN